MHSTGCYLSYYHSRASSPPAYIHHYLISHYSIEPPPTSSSSLPSPFSTLHLSQQGRKEGRGERDLNSALFSLSSLRQPSFHVVRNSPNFLMLQYCFKTLFKKCILGICRIVESHSPCGQGEVGEGEEASFC